MHRYHVAIRYEICVFAIDLIRWSDSGASLILAFLLMQRGLSVHKTEKFRLYWLYFTHFVTKSQALLGAE